MDVQANIEALLKGKADVLQLCQSLNEHSVRWAIYAGSEVALLTGNRVPTDIDIIVHDDDFETVASIAAYLSRYDDQSETVTTTEGQKIGFIASGLAGKAGETDIDIMAKADFVIAEQHFPIRLTDFAANHRTSYEVDGVRIYLAPVFDTILIKAFMRRGAEQHKFDFADAKALSERIVVDLNYRQERSKEVGTTPEVKAFLDRIGL